MFGGAGYWREFGISKWVELDNKNSLEHKDNTVKQLKTANSNSLSAFWGREGLLSGGYLRGYFLEVLILDGLIRNIMVFPETSRWVSLVIVCLVFFLLVSLEENNHRKK